MYPERFLLLRPLIDGYFRRQIPYGSRNPYKKIERAEKALPTGFGERLRNSKGSNPKDRESQSKYHHKNFSKDC